MERGKTDKKATSLNLLGIITPTLRALMRQGRLTIIDTRGRKYTLDSGASGPSVTIKLHSALLPVKLMMRPSLALGEAYMDGTLSIEEGDVRDLLAIVTSDLDALDEMPFEKLRATLSKVATALKPIRRRRAAKNVAHHYDLSNEFYALFLDTDWQYSCAYFCDGCQSLEDAQAAKRDHIARKLMLHEGARVLDVGCGWGGLALDLAAGSKADVTGISLSEEQLALARQRASDAGLDAQVRFEFRDYRDIEGDYDRIVSVGMFEHVGPPSYDAFFRSIKEHLAPDGLALVHSIGRMSPPGGKDPWIDKYIFPGGYIPSLSETVAAVERAGLWVADVEILRLHYAETLRHWYERFHHQRDTAEKLFDERFCRMWEYYLAACEMMFRNGDLMVFQLQLSRRRDAVPLTRDYLYGGHVADRSGDDRQDLAGEPGCCCAVDRKLQLCADDDHSGQARIR
jgi:cyclopropane-fatty-acyl-phospholipid synthase